MMRIKNNCDNYNLHNDDEDKDQDDAGWRRTDG